MNEDSAAPTSETSAAPAAPSFEGGVATSDDIAAVAASLEAKSAGADSSPARNEDPGTPAAAPTKPSGDSVVSSTPPSGEDAGPIPLARHKEILENTRKKAADEAKAELQQRYGWADKYQPDVVEQGTRLFQWLQQNPLEFRGWLEQEIQQRGISQPKAEERPQPDLRAEDGTFVYSAEQAHKLLEHERKQVLAELRKEFGPVKEAHTRQELEHRAGAQAESIVAEARANWPMFRDLEPVMKRLMAPVDKGGSALDLQAAYFSALRNNGLPSVEQKVRSQYEGALTQKASATTTRPGAQAETPVKYSEMDTIDIVRHLAKQQESAGRR